MPPSSNRRRPPPAEDGQRGLSLGRELRVPGREPRERERRGRGVPGHGFSGCRRRGARTGAALAGAEDAWGRRTGGCASAGTGVREATWRGAAEPLAVGAGLREATGPRVQAQGSRGRRYGEQPAAAAQSLAVGRESGATDATCRAPPWLGADASTTTGVVAMDRTGSSHSGMVVPIVDALRQQSQPQCTDVKNT